MKVTRILFTALLSLTLIFSLIAQQTAEKTLIKSFNILGNDVVDLALDGDIQVMEWNSPAIRIEMLITVENGNETMLKSLIKAGRYNLVSAETDEAFQVSMPGIERDVVIKGKPLVDRVSYLISVPSGVNVREVTTTAAIVD